MNDVRQRVHGTWLAGTAVMAMAFVVTATSPASMTMPEVPASQPVLVRSPAGVAGRVADSRKQSKIDFGASGSRREPPKPTVTASIVWGSLAGQDSSTAFERRPAAFPAVTRGGGAQLFSAAALPIPNR